MRRAGLTYNIIGGFSFYERMEVRDIIAYLKLALNPNDSIALQRVINSPPRGIGKQTLDEIERRTRDYGLSLWETIALVIKQPENLSPRAINALRSFRGTIMRLGEMAGTDMGPTEAAQAVITEMWTIKSEDGADDQLRSSYGDDADRFGRQRPFQ